MQDSRDTLTPKQVTVVTSLLSGQSVEGAAKEAKVNPATIHRWLKDPLFKDALDSGRRELAELGLGLLLALVRNAVGVQADHLRPQTRVQIRQRASEFVIEHALEWIELKDLKDRIEALEARYGEKL